MLRAGCLHTLLYSDIGIRHFPKLIIMLLMDSLDSARSVINSLAGMYLGAPSIAFDDATGAFLWEWAKSIGSALGRLGE